MSYSILGAQDLSSQFTGSQMKNSVPKMDHTRVSLMPHLDDSYEDTRAFRAEKIWDLELMLKGVKTLGVSRSSECTWYVGGT